MDDVRADQPDLTAVAATELAARVRDGRSCAVDVAAAHLRRIAARDPDLGALQAHDPDRVLAEAGAVDTRADRFALPLAGVPVVVSDDLDVAGHPTRRGCAATSTEPARRDDDLVKRLRAAGAVIVGKSRTSELGLWAFTRSALGTTHDPLDPARDPGGGAGGAAAAVAAGMAALAVGTDAGGAVRIPAAYCGLVGVKPGAGVLPRPRDAEPVWSDLLEAGILARSAHDAALLLGVLAAEPVGLDAAPAPRRVALALGVPLAGWATPFVRLHPDHRAAAVGAAARLRAGPDGAAVALADPPYPGGLPRQWRRRWQVAAARQGAGLTPPAPDVPVPDPVGPVPDRGGPGHREPEPGGPRPRGLQPSTAAAVRAGRRVLRFAPPGPAAPAAWRDRLLDWLDGEGYDLLVQPATARPAPAAGAPAGRGYRRAVLGEAGRLAYSTAWNLAGLPAVVAPVLVKGRPVGVQLVGRPGAEAALLAAAARLERRVVPAVEPATPRVYV